MRKIPTLFKRDPKDMRHLLPEVTPGCEWVLEGEGVATRKYDGACCMIRDGVLWKRREIKKGKTPPEDFEPVENDPNTGKTFGWVPVGDGPEDHYFMAAFRSGEEKDGTYELVGPKVQGGAEGFSDHHLVKHGNTPVFMVPVTFPELRERLTADDFKFEGIVWHHPDGRMAKIKKRDFE